MSNAHRIHWFDQQIRESRYPNSGHMAERFEISRRQAQRDIEYMEHTLRAPLLYIAKHRGYEYEDRAYVLPHLYMTDEERNVLRFLAQRYGQYNHDNAAAVRRVASLLERFAGDDDLEGLARLPLFDTDPELLQTVLRLSEAIKESRVVRLVYEGEELQARPLRLLSHYNTDYAAVYSETDAGERMLRLDRIRMLQITDRRFDPAKPTGGIPEFMAPPVRKPFTAKLRMASAPTPDGGAWNGYGWRRTDAPDLFEVDFYDAETFERHLTTAEWEAIVAPKWLIAKLRSRYARLLGRLEGKVDG